MLLAWWILPYHRLRGKFSMRLVNPPAASSFIDNAFKTSSTRVLLPYSCIDACPYSFIRQLFPNARKIKTSLTLLSIRLTDRHRLCCNHRHLRFRDLGPVRLSTLDTAQYQGSLLCPQKLKIQTAISMWILDYQRPSLWLQPILKSKIARLFRRRRLIGLHLPCTVCTR
jgi:hypothetical protein